MKNKEVYNGCVKTYVLGKKYQLVTIFPKKSFFTIVNIVFTQLFAFCTVQQANTDLNAFKPCFLVYMAYSQSTTLNIIPRGTIKC